MNPFFVEQKRIELLNLIPRLFGKTKLLQILQFIDSLLSSGNKALIDSYSVEFLPHLLQSVHSLDAFHQPPEETRTILTTLERLLQVDVIAEHSKTLQAVIDRINHKLFILDKILEGKSYYIEFSGISFPLLEAKNLGILESLTIKIGKAKEKDSFIFIPSWTDADSKTIEQTKSSFQLALGLITKYYNNPLKNLTWFQKYHEVLIYFQNSQAYYEGYSFGLALTIAFIEELTKYYNLPYIVTTSVNTAITGGINSHGGIIPVNEEAIQAKVSTVFFSPIEYFVIPKKDEIAAENKLELLKKIYPDRNLELVPVKDLKDLLDRRNIVSIKKQTNFTRAYNGIKRNKLAAALSLTILLMLGFFWTREFDNNPFAYEETENQLILVNKNNKPLWSIKSKYNTTFKKYNPEAIESKFRIIDIDKDGHNEVLFSFFADDGFSDGNISQGMVLFDHKGKILWTRSFRKHVTSKRELITPPYSLYFYDTLTIKNDLCILCGANNGNSYASAAFILDIKNNKVVSDTLWNPGHIDDIRTIDLDNDGKKELVFEAANNGKDNLSLYSLEVNDLKGQVPTRDDYKLLNIPDTKLINYILIPNTDFCKYYGLRRSASKKRGLLFDHESNAIRIITVEAGYEKGGTILYSWHYENNTFDIGIGDDIRLMRDSLVSRGILKKPYTDTKEFRDLLIKQILFWNGEKFVSRENLK